MRLILPRNFRQMLIMGHLQGNRGGQFVVHTADSFGKGGRSVARLNLAHASTPRRRQEFNAYREAARAQQVLRGYATATANTRHLSHPVTARVPFAYATANAKLRCGYGAGMMRARCRYAACTMRARRRNAAARLWVRCRYAAGTIRVRRRYATCRLQVLLKRFTIRSLCLTQGPPPRPPS
jgi:hypothetical protein